MTGWYLVIWVWWQGNFYPYEDSIHATQTECYTATAPTVDLYEYLLRDQGEIYVWGECDYREEM